MNYDHEVIEIDNRMAANVIIHEKAKFVVPEHWHNHLELTYILKGEMNICIDGNASLVKSDDLIVINSKQVHSIQGDNEDVFIGLTIIVSYDFLKKSYPDIDKIVFELRDNKELMDLKRIFREIAIFYTQSNNSLNYLKINSLVYEVMYILLKNYTVKKDTINSCLSQKYLERMMRITDYINENYKDNISLEDVAMKFNFSKEYLSRSFTKYMGINFKNYLVNVRLSSAYRDLINTDYSITHIALENGFPNLKSFITAFKRTYGETPYKYIRNMD
ncbi:AraC family transcriptional regulator [uncultured Clostridium sp.]|uniref:AraC family transcriptional regulator n=1 Tax=uncultured Clostridium sp. TaxID=59620 RepID=UPI00280B9732|nr:AraC family transcriptional regulator [uncultured Clostridium sp.]